MDTKKKEFVSIYTTIYNIKNCETNCIDAILNQTHDNFEWIIIYDFVEDYSFFKNRIGGDKRVKFFMNDSSGRYMALIQAIEKCSSEYVFNQDYDDIPKPYRIELQLEELLKSNKIGAVGGWYLADYKDLNLVEEHFDEGNLDIIKLKLTYMLPFAHTFCGFRKSAILEVGGYPRDSIQEDGLLWALLIAKGFEVCIVKKNLGTHFIHKNTTFGKLGKSRDLIFVKEKYRIRSVLDLPRSLNILITIRFLYRFLPSTLRSLIRRFVGNYKIRKS